MPNHDLKIAVRRDIWAIKQWDSTVDDYCIVKMFRSAVSALLYKRDNQMFNMPPLKVVHPPNYVVDAFVLVGNEIYP